MAKRSAGAEPSAILAVVIEFLETRGTDGWQLREVAERLRMSLSTLYKFFPSRDELIVAAVELWMEQHAFEPIVPPAPEESVFEALNAMFHTIFEPWEQHPEMLHVYIRTGEAGARGRLLAQGRAATRPPLRRRPPWTVHGGRHRHDPDERRRRRLGQILERRDRRHRHLADPRTHPAPSRAGRRRSSGIVSEGQTRSTGRSHQASPSS